MSNKSIFEAFKHIDDTLINIDGASKKKEIKLNNINESFTDKILNEDFTNNDYQDVDVDGDEDTSDEYETNGYHISRGWVDGVKSYNQHLLDLIHYNQKELTAYYGKDSVRKINQYRKSEVEDLLDKMIIKPNGSALVSKPTYSKIQKLIAELSSDSINNTVYDTIDIGPAAHYINVYPQEKEEDTDIEIIKGNNFIDFFNGIYEGDYGLPFEKTISYIDKKYKYFINIGSINEIPTEDRENIYNYAKKEATSWDEVDFATNSLGLLSYEEGQQLVKDIFGEDAYETMNENNNITKSNSISDKTIIVSFTTISDFFDDYIYHRARHLYPREDGTYYSDRESRELDYTLTDVDEAIRKFNELKNNPKIGLVTVNLVDLSSYNTTEYASFISKNLLDSLEENGKKNQKMDSEFMKFNGEKMLRYYEKLKNKENFENLSALKNIANKENEDLKEAIHDYEDEPSSPHIIYVNTDRLQKIDIDDVFASYDIPYNLNFEPTYWGGKWCVIYNDDWSLLFERQKSGNIEIYYVFGPEKDPNGVRMGHSLKVEIEGIETYLFNKELIYKIFEEKSVPDLLEDSRRIENKWEYEAMESLDNQEKEIYKAISEVEAKADMEDVIGIYDMCDTYSDMSKEVYGYRDRGIFERARSKFGPNLRKAEKEFDALTDTEQDRIRMAFYDKLKQRADNKLEAILKENTLIADELAYQPIDN